MRASTLVCWPLFRTMLALELPSLAALIRWAAVIGSDIFISSPSTFNKSSKKTQTTQEMFLFHAGWWHWIPCDMYLAADIRSQTFLKFSDEFTDENTHSPSCSRLASLCRAMPDAKDSMHPLLPQEHSGPSNDTMMWPNSAAQKVLPCTSSFWWIIPPPIP